MTDARNQDIQQAIQISLESFKQIRKQLDEFSQRRDESRRKPNAHIFWGFEPDVGLRPQDGEYWEQDLLTNGIPKCQAESISMSF